MGEAFIQTAAEPLLFDLIPQPNDTSCGPTCLHALYRYYEDVVPLPALMGEIPSLETGGTLAVHLGLHALKRGYNVRLYTYNLRIFDPTWFNLPTQMMLEKLRERQIHTQDPKRAMATRAYADFIEAGGEVRMHDLDAGLLRKYLRKGVPILTGLSSTYLYQSMREIPDETCRDDDIHGEPCGHFVVVNGYDPEKREALVSDPYEKNPFRRGQQYKVSLDRLITAILLGVLTYDANLLIIRPHKQSASTAEGTILRRQKAGNLSPRSASVVQPL